MPDKSSVWFQFFDKETQNDIDYDFEYERQYKNTSLEYTHKYPTTTRKEIWSWWLYEWANSPFFGVAQALLFPVYVAELSTRYACLNNAPYGCDNFGESINSDYIPRVSIGKAEYTPASFSSMCISISGAMQAVAYLGISAFADKGSFSKPSFIITTFVSCIMMMVWIFILKPSQWAFAGFWGAMTNVPAGLGVIFWNAFLLQLVGSHFRLRRLKKKYITDGTDKKEFDKEYQSETLIIQDEMSVFGVAFGFCGSTVVTILAVVIMFGLNETANSLSGHYGITRDTIKAHDNNILSNIDHKTEYWRKKVGGYVIHTSTNNINETVINGMQLYYSDINIYGDFHGSMTGTSITVDSEYIQSVYVYEKKASPPYIVGIQFEYINNSLSPTYGDSNLLTNNRLQAKPKLKKGYKKFVLSGYEVTTAIKDGVKIITGFDFSFTNKDKGQYGSTLGLAFGTFFVGCWYLLFSLPALFNVKSRPKAPIPKTETCVPCLSFKVYGRTFKEARKFPNLFRLLIAWFIYSDAANTTTSTGLLFGQTVLGMDSIDLLIMLLEVEFFGVIGGLFWAWFRKKFNKNTKEILLYVLIFMTILPIYCTLGFIEPLPFGLKHKNEMFVFGFIYGWNQSTMISLSQSLYGHFIPTGKENEFFGLFEITDKGSSWIGPLFVSIIANYASMRWALVYVAFMWIVGLILFYYGVNLEKGIKEAGKLHILKDEFHISNDIDMDKANTDDTSNKDITNNDTTKYADDEAP